MHEHEDAQKNFAAEIAPPVVAKAPWRIAEVKALPDYRLWVRFNDGLEGTADISGLVHSSHAGVFAALRDKTLFERVTLHYGAVTWPGELDLAPDAMHECIRRNGKWVPN
jgi:hypothetical protein